MLSSIVHRFGSTRCKLMYVIIFFFMGMGAFNLLLTSAVLIFGLAIGY